MKWYDPTIMTPPSNAAEMADTWNDITGEGIPFIHDVIHYNFHQNDNKSVLYDLVLINLINLIKIKVQLQVVFIYLNMMEIIIYMAIHVKFAMMVH